MGVPREAIWGWVKRRVEEWADKRVMERFTVAREKAKERAKQTEDARPDWDPDQVLDSTEVTNYVTDWIEVPDDVVDLPPPSSVGQAGPLDDITE